MSKKNRALESHATTEETPIVVATETVVTFKKALGYEVIKDENGKVILSRPIQ